MSSSFNSLKSPTQTLKWSLLAVLSSAALMACGGDNGDPTSIAPTPETPAPAPAPEPETPATPPETPQPPASPYLGARAGDVLKVTIDQLHPTQGVIGYDQIYYHLGRKQPDPQRYAATSAGYLGDDAEDNYSRYLYRSERKRADDYCADNGQGGIDDRSYKPLSVKLLDPTTFQCAQPEPTAGSTGAQVLKTVIVGPQGALYLTDGHHTFTALNELGDGGPQLPVWVRVADNYSDLTDMAAFWQRMENNHLVWLRDAQNQAITPAALPDRIGLAQFQDDAYRSLVYLTRDLGYSNASVSEFAEFYWGSGLRSLGLDLDKYSLRNLDRARITLTDGAVGARAGDSTTSYVAAVRDAAIKMVSLGANDIVAGGQTAANLGQLQAPASAGAWNDMLEDDIWRADTSSSGRYRTAGKAWYAAKYRQCNGPSSTQPACWLTVN